MCAPVSFYLTGKALLVMSARLLQGSPQLSDLRGKGILYQETWARPQGQCRRGLQTPGVKRTERGREGCFERGDGSGHLQSPHRKGTQRTPSSGPITQELEGKGPIELVPGPSQPVGPWGTERDGDRQTDRHSNTGQCPEAATASDYKLGGLKQG